MSGDPGGLLVLDDVTCGYAAGGPILRGASLDVQRGEVVAVVSLDASGGKSTLVRAAAGLLPPRKGAVRFDGQDVYAMGYADDQRFRARCAVVLEGGALLVNQTVRDNVALPLRYHRGLAGRELDVNVERLLEQAGFTEDARAFPWQVSVRGRKLAAFARAMALDPELVIVDRFFEGLEMPDWKRLFELVLELNTAEGTTWLLVSETDPAIFQVAERVAVLEGGRVLDCGHRRQLFADERVRAAFEAGDDEVRGARKTGRVAAAAAAGDSERILIVDSNEELEALAAGSDPDLDPVAAPTFDPETTIVLDGVVPPAAASPRPSGAQRAAGRPSSAQRAAGRPSSAQRATRALDQTSLDATDVTIDLPPPPRASSLAGEETICIDGELDGVLPRIEDLDSSDSLPEETP